MPNHCFQAINENPRTTAIVDFEVVWNEDVSGVVNYQDTDADSETKVSEILCDIQRTNDSNMMSSTGYVERGDMDSNIATASGVSVSGALIYNALDGDNLDAVEQEWYTLDNCLTHPTPFGAYHYHSWSPCYKKGNGFASQTQAPNMCKDTDACKNAPMTWAIDNGFADTSMYGTNANIMGVAKDGHMIWGPYDENGELWDCADHDICNGAFIDGNYVYLSTTTFPYILGCFGPGPTQSYQASCTSGGCGGSSDSSTDAATMMTSLTAISSALIALLYF